MFDFFDLRRESLQDAPTSFLTTYEQELRLGTQGYRTLLQQTDWHALMLGAFIEQKLIGFVGLYSGTLINISLWGLYITPKFRHQEKGYKLMQSAIACARDQMQFKVAYLAYQAENTAAKKLYERLSFQEWGCEPLALSINNEFYTLNHMSLQL